MMIDHDKAPLLDARGGGDGDEGRGRSACATVATGATATVALQFAWAPYFVLGVLGVFTLFWARRQAGWARRRAVRVASSSCSSPR